MMQLIMSNNQVVKLSLRSGNVGENLANNADSLIIRTTTSAPRVTSEPTLTPTPMPQLLHHQRALHQSRMDHQGVYF